MGPWGTSLLGTPQAHSPSQPRAGRRESSHSARHDPLQGRPRERPSRGSIPLQLSSHPACVRMSPGTRPVQGQPAHAQPSRGVRPPGRDERPGEAAEGNQCRLGAGCYGNMPSQTAVCATDELMGWAVSGTRGEPWEGLSAGAPSAWTPDAGGPGRNPASGRPGGSMSPSVNSRPQNDPETSRSPTPARSCTWSSGPQTESRPPAHSRPQPPSPTTRQTRPRPRGRTSCKSDSIASHHHLPDPGRTGPRHD